LLIIKLLWFGLISGHLLQVWLAQLEMCQASGFKWTYWQLGVLGDSKKDEQIDWVHIYSTLRRICL